MFEKRIPTADKTHCQLDTSTKIMVQYGGGMSNIQYRVSFGNIDPLRVQMKLRPSY